MQIIFKQLGPTDVFSGDLETSNSPQSHEIMTIRNYILNSIFAWKMAVAKIAWKYPCCEKYGDSMMIISFNAVS